MKGSEMMIVKQDFKEVIENIEQYVENHLAMMGREYSRKNKKQIIDFLKYHYSFKTEKEITERKLGREVSGKEMEKLKKVFLRELMLSFSYYVDAGGLGLINRTNRTNKTA